MGCSFTGAGKRKDLLSRLIRALSRGLDDEGVWACLRTRPGVQEQRPVMMYWVYLYDVSMFSDGYEEGAFFMRRIDMAFAIC